MIVDLDDPRVSVEGLAELSRNGGWWVPSRLPTEIGEPAVSDGVLRRSRMAAGVRLNFRTDSSEIGLDVDAAPDLAVADDISPFDVCIDGRLVLRQIVRGPGRLHLEGLGSADKDVAIWLPQFGVAKLGALSLRDGSTIVAPANDRTHLVTYGSSITQCRQASGPSETWPALVAAERGWRLTNLGFAGECQLDLAVARHIRDTSADLLSLCLGINIWGSASFSRRTLAPAIAGFVATIRDGHPTTPLIVTTPIASPDRETTPNLVSLTLQDIRSIVAEVVLVLCDGGDSRLSLIDGREILRPEEDHLLADGLHPGPEGYRLMARRLGPRLAAALP